MRHVLWCKANDPVESKCLKHMSQILFLGRDCVAEGAAGGTGEGADGVTGLDDGVGDLELGSAQASAVSWSILV